MRLTATALLAFSIGLTSVVAIPTLSPEPDFHPVALAIAKRDNHDLHFLLKRVPGGRPAPTPQDPNNPGWRTINRNRNAIVNAYLQRVDERRAQQAHQDAAQTLATLSREPRVGVDPSRSTSQQQSSSSRANPSRSRHATLPLPPPQGLAPPPGNPAAPPRVPSGLGSATPHGSGYHEPARTVHRGTSLGGPVQAAQAPGTGSTRVIPPTREPSHYGAPGVPAQAYPIPGSTAGFPPAHNTNRGAPPGSFVQPPLGQGSTTQQGAGHHGQSGARSGPTRAPPARGTSVYDPVRNMWMTKGP